MVLEGTDFSMATPHRHICKPNSQLATAVKDRGQREGKGDECMSNVATVSHSLFRGGERTAALFLVGAVESTIAILQ